MPVFVGSDYFDCCCLELIRLPSPDVIGKSLYTLYIGQNDFTSNLGAIGVVSSSSGLTNCLYHQGERLLDSILYVGQMSFGLDHQWDKSFPLPVA